MKLITLCRSTATYTILAAGLILSPGCGRSGNDATTGKVQTFAVEVTDVAGQRQSLTGFRREIASHSFQSRVSSDTPTLVITPSDQIYLRGVDPEHPYLLQLPLELVRVIEFQVRDADDWNLNRYLHATVTLLDGQVLCGGTSGHFVGEGSLGQVSLRIESDRFEERGVKRLEFVGRPAAIGPYRAPVWGRHKAVLHKRDGGTLEFLDAAFVAPRANKNGCWIGDAPGEELFFEKGSAQMQVPWAKLASIAPVDADEMYDRGERLTLTARDGSVTKGSVPSYANIADSVRGRIKLGAHTLWAEIELGRCAKSVFRKIEFE